MLHRSHPISAARPRRTTIAARMSAVMVERESVAGACTEENLVAAGFTRNEIALHSDAAASLAAQRQNRA